MALDIKSKPQFAGAYNLLANCGEAQSGERLLLCYEPSNLGYYDQKIIDDVHNCALEMGLAVTLCELGFDPYVAQLPAGLDQAMDSADLTVFLAYCRSNAIFQLQSWAEIYYFICLNRGIFGLGIWRCEL
jgi:hypothetical protein